MEKTMTALLVPFCALLAAGCTPQSNYDALQQRYEESQTANQKLESENQALQTQLQQAQQSQYTYTISTDLLFAPDGFAVSANGQAVLNDIIARLRGLRGGKIFVYSYTDDAKIGPPLKKLGINSNMELSSKRAEIVADFLRAHGVNPAMVSAEGRAETQPVAPNDTAEGRAKNRRVEIVLEAPANWSSVR